MIWLYIACAVLGPSLIFLGCLIGWSKTAAKLDAASWDKVRWWTRRRDMKKFRALVEHHTFNDLRSNLKHIDRSYE